MYKIILAAGTMLSSMALMAQEPADALRLGWTAPSGTARQQAIGGAMGSLGGDLSATFVNPAGLAFYRTGDLVITPYFRYDKSKGSYLNRTEKARDNNLTLGTSGVVFGSGQTTTGRNVAISFAFNRAADFNNTILYRGANRMNSFSQQYVDQLNLSDKSDTVVNYGFLGGATQAFRTYWVDPVYDNNGKVTGFKTKFPMGSELLQEQTVINNGGINEYALGVGVDMSKKLMLGGTLGIPVVNHSREATFTEADPTDDATNNFNFATVNDNTSTRGVGFNAKLGLIYKPVEYVRLGLAFHTPTFYNMRYRYDVKVTTDTEGSQGELYESTSDIIGAQAEMNYYFTTPYRAIASASYVIREIEDVTKQKGFITADIEYINYRASSYYEDTENGSDEETKAYLQDLNNAIDNAYKGAFNFRLGGELKFTTIMVRAGAAYFGNPYKKINGDEKGHRINLSAGLGYRNKGRFIDLTYVHALNRDVHFAYRLQNAPYAAAQINSNVGNVLLTFGFKF